ncbi:MAG: MogA/MoaB family molybdenum cofactor biosynthesis protein [Chloroflexi bacterium]|nr:MogA/MoaB family molybdenum cofactor biosynthesis protein [Chloroflexota bacterium]
MSLRFAILTVSDRSARGEREDISGARLAQAVAEAGWQVVAQSVCPDEIPEITAYLKNWTASGDVDVILTTGGTGFAPRDVTPEATLKVIERPAPGLAEAIRAEGRKTMPHAMLSRAVAGIRGQTILLNLPGNPKGVEEAWEVVRPVLAHAAALLKGDQAAEGSHRKAE